jgi:ribonuclease BN (tRNA processing enzyme)
MRIQVLGGHGGLAKGHSTTSFLIDDTFLIDAGAVASTLAVSEQAKIQNIIISHSHLDHIKDLAFICDNCFGMKTEPFHVYTHETVKQIIMKHLFNETIWPDFTRLPSPSKPTIEFKAVNPEEKFKVGDFLVRGVKVKHPNDAMGFIIEKSDIAVLFTLDTAATNRIWEIAKEYKNIKAIFTEVSFPNSLQDVAIASDHHTPQSLKIEISKMPKEIPIILTHLKPNFRSVIMREIQELCEKRIHVLEEDGQVFQF